MTLDDRRLGGFEERLLTQLKNVVATRSGISTVPARTVTARLSRRLALTIGAAAALAVAASIAVPGIFGRGSSPAYAVERDAEGSIRIHIWEYRDPNGLQRKLQHFGVNAVVDFVPNGKQCKEPRATYAPDVPGLLTTEPPPGDEEAYWKLHPQLIKPGETFVFTAQIYGDPRTNHTGTAKAQYRLAIGPVAPCELIPGPRLRPGGG